MASGKIMCASEPAEGCEGRYYSWTMALPVYSFTISRAHVNCTSDTSGQKNIGDIFFNPNEKEMKLGGGVSEKKERRREISK